MFGRIQWKLEAEADAEGRFRIEVPVAGPDRLTVAAPGFLPGRHRVDRWEEETAETVVVLRPGGRALAGIVTDDGDEPLPGVEVTWAHPGIPDLSLSFCRRETDDRGRFRFDGVPDGACSLRAEDPFRARASLAVEAGSEGVRIRLRAAGVVEGEVRLPPGSARDENAPAGGVILSPEGETGHTRSAGLKDRSFRIEHVEPGMYSVQARVPGAGAGRVDGVEVRAGEIARVTVDAGPGESLSGRVVAGDGEDPIAGALVVAVEDSMGINETMFTSERVAREMGGVCARTDARGGFVLAGLTASPLWLGAAAPGFVPTLRMDVPVPGEEEVRLRLAPAGRLRVRVEGSGGAPVLEYRLALVHPNRAVREDWDPVDGEVVFEDLPAGGYDVGVEAEACAVRARVVVRVGGTTELCVRIPATPHALSGRLTGIGEQERPRFVQARHEDADGRLYAFFSPIDEAAEFHFDALPAGEVCVVPVYREERFWTEPGVHFTLPAESAQVEVPVVKATLRVLDDETGRPLCPPGDPDGIVDVFACEAGLAEVVLAPRPVEGPRYHPARVVGLAPGERREVRIRRALTAWIAVSIGYGPPIPGATIHITDADGWRISDATRFPYQHAPPLVRPELFCLAPGAYTVRVEHPDRAPHEEPITVSKEETGFRIHLARV